MDAKNADLSALRINRAPPEAGEPGTRPNWGRWILLTVLVIVAIAVATLATRGMRGGIAVRLAPATLVAPSQANVVVIASGYVVAQRKAAVASKGTGRLVYLGVVEGDRVRTGQVLARIEDSDIRAQLAQARAQLQLARADLRDVTAVLARQKFLLDSGLTSQAEYDGSGSGSRCRWA